MTDIFLCYSRRDSDIANKLENCLINHGWVVFRDVQTEIGARWHKEIEKELHTARSVIVLWSEHSCDSDYVLEEAEYGRKNKILYPALIQAIEPPYGFGRIQTANLVGWRGENNHSGLKSLLTTLQKVLGTDIEAAPMYRKAAEKGDAIAQNRLGVMYQNGRGVPRDDAEAVKWYSMAAMRGHADAQNNLGWMYQNGLGVARDYAEALRWFRKADEQGNASAQNNLGLMFKNGEGVTQNYAEALRWFRKAAEQGNASAQNNLGWLYQNGRGAARDDKEAIKWFLAAAAQGNATALYNIGWIFQHGRGVTRDNVEAAKWYRMAAERGHTDANKIVEQLEMKKTGFFSRWFS